MKNYNQRSELSTVIWTNHPYIRACTVYSGHWPIEPQQCALQIFSLTPCVSFRLSFTSPVRSSFQYAERQKNVTMCCHNCAQSREGGESARGNQRHNWEKWVMVQIGFLIGKQTTGGKKPKLGVREKTEICRHIVMLLGQWPLHRHGCTGDLSKWLWTAHFVDCIFDPPLRRVQ